MSKKDLTIVNIVSEILDLKKQNPSKTDSEIIGIFIEKNNYRKKEHILDIKYADIALKIKFKNKKLSRNQIIQKILEESS